MAEPEMAVRPKSATPAQAYEMGRQGIQPRYNGMSDTVEREWGERLPSEVDAQRLFPYNQEAQKAYVQGDEDRIKAQRARAK